MCNSCAPNLRLVGSTLGGWGLFPGVTFGRHGLREEVPAGWACPALEMRTIVPISTSTWGRSSPCHCAKGADPPGLNHPMTLPTPGWVTYEANCLPCDPWCRHCQSRVPALRPASAGARQPRGRDGSALVTDHAVLSCGVLAPSALHDLTQDASVDVGQLRDVEAYPSRRVLPQPLQQRVVRPFLG